MGGRGSHLIVAFDVRALVHETKAGSHLVLANREGQWRLTLRPGQQVAVEIPAGWGGGGIRGRRRACSPISVRGLAVMEDRAGDGTEAAYASACACRTVTGRGTRGHLVVFRVNLGALGKELVNEAHLAAVRRVVQRGLAILRWGRRAKAAMKEGVVARAKHEIHRRGCIWFERHCLDGNWWR
jgi:uncharacterized protein YbdZ (MbtH family)